jgi:hypothetical protein
LSSACVATDRRAGNAGNKGWVAVSDFLRVDGIDEVDIEGIAARGLNTEVDFVGLEVRRKIRQNRRGAGAHGPLRAASSAGARIRSVGDGKREQSEKCEHRREPKNGRTHVYVVVCCS